MCYRGLANYNPQRAVSMLPTILGSTADRLDSKHRELLVEQVLKSTPLRYVCENLLNVTEQLDNEKQSSFLLLLLDVFPIEYVALDDELRFFEKGHPSNVLSTIRNTDELLRTLLPALPTSTYDEVKAQAKAMTA
jgi:hypothetical protein